MLRRLLLAASLPTLLAAQLVTSPAEAATAARPDARGDAPAAIDIVRLRAATSPGVVGFKLKVRELRSRGTFVVGFYEPGGSGSIGFVVTRSQGRTKVTARATDLDDSFDVACPGARARWDARRNVISVRGPEKCLYFAQADDSWFVYASSRLARKRDRVEAFEVARA